MTTIASIICALLVFAQGVEIDYFQPAFRDPFELVALSKPFLSDKVQVSVEPKASRLRVESESKAEVAKTVKLLQFIDRNALEFSVEISFDYLERLEKLGYSCELAPVFSGVLTGVLKKEQQDAKTFSTASEKTQQFTVSEKQSVDVYTGRTKQTLEMKDVYVQGDKSIVKMEAIEKICGFNLSTQLTPTGPRLAIEPYCNISSGTEQKSEFTGPKFAFPVEFKKSIALYIPDDPHYPQAQRISSALFIWANERLERRPVLVFNVDIKGLDEIVGEVKK